MPHPFTKLCRGPRVQPTSSHMCRVQFTNLGKARVGDAYFQVRALAIDRTTVLRQFDVRMRKRRIHPEDGD